MTHDDIIRLAREVADPDTVDPLCGGDHRDLITLNLNEMMRFAALIAADRDALRHRVRELEEAMRLCGIDHSSLIRIATAIRGSAP